MGAVRSLLLLPPWVVTTALDFRQGTTEVENNGVIGRPSLYPVTVAWHVNATFPLKTPSSRPPQSV